MATLQPTLLALSLVAGTLTFAACGDDGNFIGSDPGAGSGGQATTSSAGAAHAGTANTAAGTGGKTSSGGGASNGGNSNGGGTTGTGGAACDVGECIRANVCLDECGG